MSDSEQGQYFASKGYDTTIVEHGSSSLYRAIFNEKFTFTLGESPTTDTLNVKVFYRISSAVPLSESNGIETSELELECLSYRVKDNLLKFFDQKERT